VTGSQKGIRCTVRKLVLLVLFATLSGVAKTHADYLWTWHGDSNYFQGTFEVTDQEMLPNSHFTSPLFTNTLNFSSLDGVVYHGTNSDVFLSAGFGPPLHASLVLYDSLTQARLSVAVVPNQGSAIAEISNLSSGNNGENGFWSFSRIPEPSVTALASLGVLFAAKRGCTI
jgi:hypothetical protein